MIDNSCFFAVAWPTVFYSTGEILNPCYRAIVLPLWFVKLHSSPEAPGELGAAAESQGSHLQTHRISMYHWKSERWQCFIAVNVKHTQRKNWSMRQWCVKSFYLQSKWRREQSRRQKLDILEVSVFTRATEETNNNKKGKKRSKMKMMGFDEPISTTWHTAILFSVWQENLLMVHSFQSKCPTELDLTCSYRVNACIYMCTCVCSWDDHTAGTHRGLYDGVKC